MKSDRYPQVMSLESASVVEVEVEVTPGGVELEMISALG